MARPFQENHFNPKNFQGINTYKNSKDLEKGGVFYGGQRRYCPYKNLMFQRYCRGSVIVRPFQENHFNPKNFQGIITQELHAQELSPFTMMTLRP